MFNLYNRTIQIVCGGLQPPLAHRKGKVTNFDDPGSG